MSVEGFRIYGGLPPKPQPVEGEPGPYFDTPTDRARQQQEHDDAQADLDRLNEYHRRAFRGETTQLIRDPRTGQVRDYL